ncbi:MAG: FHA domain-containing protein [Anaerolineae bacterium]
MKCPNCGAEMTADSLFCPTCETEVIPLSEQQAEPSSSPVDDDHVAETLVTEEPLPRLVISAGVGKGQEFVLKGDVRLGREADNDIVLLDPKISRQHAAFTLVQGGYTIADLGSTNGTFVNDIRISEPHRLKEGDRITIGDTELTFVKVSPIAEPAEPAVGPPPSPPRPAPKPVPPSMAPIYAPPVEKEKGLPVWLWVGCLILVLLAVLIGCAMAGALLYGSSYFNFRDWVGVFLTPSVTMPLPSPSVLATIPPPTPSLPLATLSIQLLFEDDFSDPNSGWGQASNENEERGYVDGQYSFLVKALNFFSLAVPGRSFDDLILEVDTIQVGGPNNNSYGVCLRYSERGFYRFNISGDGLYAIGKREEGEWIELTEWLESPDISQGQSTNHLKIVCQGPHFSFYVNGQHLVDVEDHSFAEGDIGLFASSYDEPGTYIRFDNLKVWPVAGKRQAP